MNHSFWPIPLFVSTNEPVMEFFEDGDWLRIEIKGKPTRYIQKKIAVQILRDYGVQSVSEKGEIYVR